MYTKTHLVSTLTLSLLLCLSNRADSWPSTPAWTGRLQVSSIGDDALIELKDPNTGVLFAACPIKIGGPPAVQKVLTHYLHRSGRHAFIGIAFNNRSDAFDFNVAIDDFSKYTTCIHREQTQLQSPAAATPKDYSLKEGQTIRIKINSTRKSKDTAEAEESDGGSDPFAWSDAPKPTSSGDADLLGLSSST
ncbi:hypothetical protein BBJ28_00012747 [Nothophytophthora sp. Chile5]|nr:hypothetical protein BBJ28_00012747 [Nothophytophthora sp. Chile5]